MKRLDTGSTTATVLPWILAFAGILFAASAWLGWSPRFESTLGNAASASQDVATLRVALASANAANESMRQELDRLRALARPPASDGRARKAGDDSTHAGPDETQQEIGKRLKDALERTAQGDPAARAEAAKEIWKLLRTGAGAGAVLRDAYLATTDARARTLLLASMTLSDSPETKDFVIDQVHGEKDPQLRRVLMGQAAKYATADMAAALAPTFVQSIDSAEDPQTRIAAIRGLRYAPGSDAPAALMRAATDPSEDVRIAALDVLASRPRGQETMLELIRNDPSPRVREFAECRAVIAKEIP